MAMVWPFNRFRHSEDSDRVIREIEAAHELERAEVIHTHDEIRGDQLKIAYRVRNLRRTCPKKPEGIDEPIPGR